MAETLAKYSFLPWVRQGLGNEIIEADTFGNAPGNGAIERPEVLVKTKVKATKGATVKIESINRTVKIQGPGDVLGLNQKTIIRVHPKNGVTNFETNNLCYVEFYEEDLPWRFTPAKAVGNKLRPWLALIVLRNDEFERNSTGGTPTPFISIDNTKLGKVFGNEKDTFALAHVHVLEDLGSGNEAADLKNKLDKNPDLALSRVICPRKLEFEEGNNEYHAFLIPAFETGRLAGMGEDPSSTKAQKPSWTRAAINNATNPSSYPYYFSWKFKVSNGGDFESLAEKLIARELPENIGKREMDLKDMGFGIEPTGSNALSYVEGAMKHENYVTSPWPITGTQLKDKLKDILNISANLQDRPQDFSAGTEFFYSPGLDIDPIISPPTYGKWHAGTHRLSSNGTNWVHDINLHPTHRAAAGLGTRVVQQHQEEFMEIAWEQIGQINEANQKIIESELAKRVANSLVKRNINRMSELDLIATTGRAFEVLKITNNSTAKKQMKSSVVPTALRSGTFVKVANKITPKALFSKDGKDGVSKILNTSFLNRLNIEEGDIANDQNKISAAPKRKEPQNALPIFTAINAINSIVLNPQKTFMEQLADAIKKVGTNFTTNAVNTNLPNTFTAEETTRANEILGGVIKSEAGSGDVDILVTVKKNIFEERISSSFDEGLYGGVKFIKPIPAGEPLLFDQNVIVQGRVDFQNLFTGRFLIEENQKVFAPVFLRPIKSILPISFRANILAKLNPLNNFQRQLLNWFNQNLENNKPIMAYPRFPIPMYDYLKDISADYIIPNISEIEPDTITLMKPNKKFIEAFLTGMNHEFSRELLWREFPTDMRGSYFRHFWEYNNNPSAEKTDEETVEQYTNRIITKQNNAADITELHKWKTKSLGQNHVGGPNLVLLIKGDLFRKYPGTLVYAQKAMFKPGDKTAERHLTDYTNENNVQWPIITGKIEPDVHFYGFELTEEEANGNRSNNPGWFFVLRERPGQISFGLDDLGKDEFGNINLDTTPENWDSVTWENITGNAGQQPDFLKIDGVNIALGTNPTEPKDATWGANASDMAYILYQSPVLFARHASTMLKD